jgi:ribosomal protein S18 acetylase RimI-like enzyme
MVRLVPMNESEFQAYREVGSTQYLRDSLKADRWSAGEALRVTERASQDPLSEDLTSPNQYLLMIEDDLFGFKVGMLWFEVCDEGAGSIAFVHDMKIFEQFRRRHYGTYAFYALEAYVRRLGLTTIRFHVFGDNLAARTMYEKLGFITTDVVMEKTLRKPGG